MSYRIRNVKKYSKEARYVPVPKADEIHGNAGKACYKHWPSV